MRPSVGAVALALAASSLFACKASDRPRKRKLTLYCSGQQEWCEAITATYEAETGVRVSMIRKSSGESYAQILAERRNPKGDVWWGGTGDVHFQAAEMKLSEPYRSPNLPRLHRWAVDPVGKGEHRTTGVYMGALGFGYNREWLEKKGLPPPTRWADLVLPAYRGEIQMANPASSGTAYTALSTFVQLLGEEKAFSYLKKLHENVNQYTKSGSAPIRAAARGETGIGISFLHDIATQVAAGFPIEMVVPDEGTGYEIGCVSLIRGARHLEEGQAFLDWSLTEAAQELGGRAHAFQIPSNRDARIPPEAPRIDPENLIDFDFNRFGQKAERDRLLQRWEREVKSRARE